MIQLINKGKSYCNLNSIIHLSTVDWHGHSSITLFLNGCSFNCQYCYNSSCLNSNRKVLLINIYSEILKSKPYISSVVFLGGEPLNQLEIIIKIAAFSKRNNLLVGLHTNGSNTTNINTLIQLKLIDKYFIDIKAPFNYIKYLKVINIKQKTYSKINKIILNIQNSIKLIDLSTSQLELKTTIFPSIIGTKNEI